MIKLLVFIPLITAIFVGLSCRTISHKKAQFITSIGLTTSAILAGIVFYDVVILKNEQVVHLLQWINSGDFKADWSLRIDSLTAIMLVVVTWVSALVHIYSSGYMSHDPNVPRFMAYLSLFTFFMLILVTSDNFLQLFVGWEGVGLCSYLLIGFWFKKQTACNAAMKAFIVNRVGDFGLILAIFAIFTTFGSLQFSEVFASASENSDAVINILGSEFHALTVICILLFIGAMGKSAQLGLHTWLPDAMEGPTPVSALIHAATMVTAGVFLVARCSALFEFSPIALSVVTIVGACTAIFAATIAITQNDIKRVIAYSTCSQLGYMFFACGVSAYSAGVFHLMTHGFFKALLFLGAGSVIHAMSNEQDMRNMGGIWKKIPYTYAMMMIGTIAIVGIPPLSGFYSKDMILESAYAAGYNGHPFGNFAYILGIAAAALTSFYSWRLIFMTFHGRSRASKKVLSHVHESPKIMTIPLTLLAIGALFAGAFASKVLGIVDGDLDFWNGTIFMNGEFNVLEAAHNVPGWVKSLPLVVGFGGLTLAFIMYILIPSLPYSTVSLFKPIHTFLFNKWFIDELYDLLFVRPIKKLGIIFWKVVDTNIIDRFGPNGAAWVSQRFTNVVSKVQSGYIHIYAFVMLIGLVGMISWFVLKDLSIISSFIR